MPISPMDEYLAHQTPETFDQVFTSDRNFYDRYYFNMHASSDELFLVTGMGQYPNLGVTDAFVSISHGDTLYVVRASRELGSDRLDTRVGPFSIEVEEGLRVLRLRLDENEWGIAFDLRFEGAVPSLEEPRQTSRDGGRILFDTSRYAQVGCYSGSLHVAGHDYTVTPDRWKGARDRSWGIRPVGEPEHPGIRAARPTSRAMFHNWVPAQFDDFMLKVFIQEDPEGRRTHEEAARIYNYGIDKPVESLGSPRHQFRYRSGTRELEQAVFSFEKSDLVLTTTPLRTVYLAFATGYIPQPDWTHGMYQGELVVQGMQMNVSTPEARRPVAILNETLSHMQLSTGETCYAMHENICMGPYQPYGFKDWESVAP